MIRDIALAPSGKQKISWVKEHMPLLNILNEKYSKNQIFNGLNMVVTIHLEAKTAYLAQVLKNAGANVVVTGSNPLSTQDDVAAALADSGVTVFATHNCTDKEYDIKYLIGIRYIGYHGISSKYDRYCSSQAYP